MNERIRELADQADAYARSEYEKWTPTPDFSGIPHIRKIFNEKFAELIVRECARVAAGTFPSDADLDNYKLGRHWASEDVLNHFGVEE